MYYLLEVQSIFRASCSLAGHCPHISMAPVANPSRALPTLRMASDAVYPLVNDRKAAMLSIVPVLAGPKKFSQSNDEGMSSS